MPGKSILVVDDAPVAQNFMRLILTHEGYTVRTASHAAEALEILNSFCPELVLAEVNLSGMDGVELARRIKHDPRTSAVKVVALTTSDPADQQRLQGTDCDGFIAKPIDAKTLAKHVRETLDRPGLPAPSNVDPSEDLAACGISGDEIEYLRRTFLKEGADRSAELLESLDQVFDQAKASRLLHSWSGTGGLMGFPEITKLARGCEELLRNGRGRLPEFRDTLGALAFTFGDLNEAHSVHVPEHVLQALQTKPIALIGFSPDRADFLCGALEHVKARPRLYTLSSAAESAESIQACELVIVRVGPESIGSAWLDPAKPLLETGTLVLSGDRRDLLNLPAAIQSAEVEFLVDTWHPEDVLMHLHRALSRRAAPQPEVKTEEPPAEAATDQAKSSRISVVIADDDNLIVTVVASTLQNYGMSCQDAANGEDALRLIRQHKPRIAVLDVNMPGRDGFEVLAAIRKEEIPTLVILLTARQREADILRGFQLGADDYMVKPFNPLELIARLKRLLKR